jgi:membrane-associated protease RseP (regulator of RpoE activity)
VSSTLVIALYVVSILVTIVIHEAAHFATAKAFKIKVEEFFVGFGPRLWSFRRGDTEYGIKALPLGGYVRIAGMNPFQEPTPEEYPRTYGAKPAWQRALVIAAGPATHFVIAFLLLAVYFGFVGQPSKIQPVVSQVYPKLNGHISPAKAAGVRGGDVIVGVDGIRDPGDQRLVSYTRHHVGERVPLKLLRGERRIAVTVVPETDRQLGYGRIGVGLSAGRILARHRSGAIGGIADGAKAVGVTSWRVLETIPKVFGPEGLGRVGRLLFTDAKRQPTDATTIVGGGQVVVEAARRGLADVLIPVLAGFNIFIGILNLFPIPPFDGGHLAVLLVEKIRRRKVDPRKLLPITAVVAAFLIVFMVSLLYLDVTKPIPVP